jgi:Xaa-Pro aminopeptidase
LAFNREEYSARREKLMVLIPDGIAIIRGASVPLGNGNFQQYNNMMYFAGLEVPDVILVIDGEKRESTLFFTIDETVADGENIPLELVRDPIKVTGIEKYLPYKEFTRFLKERVSGKNTAIYAPFSPEELIGECSGEKFNKFRQSVTENEWDGRLTEELQFVHNLKERFPGNRILDCSPQVRSLRKYKSKAEIDVLREAAKLGVEAHKEVISKTRSGITELELAAWFEFTCKKGGAKDLAFSTIIMSAEHHAYGHYAQYDRTLQEGDFVILDAGPDLKYYDADISSTFPVNGKFSPKQREIYEFGLLIRGICLENYRPGVTLAQVGAAVEKKLKEKGYNTGEKKFSGYIRNGGYNHSIGMAVHDKLDAFNRDEQLQPGFVFACDIMAKADSVTSIRIEDTVAITENGCEVLSAGLPRTVKEIEAFMRKNK